MIGPSMLLAVAAVAIALALQISDGRYDPWALALVAVAAAVGLLAAIWRRRGGSESGVLAQSVLGAGSAAGLGLWLFTVPIASADVRAFQGGFRWFVLISLVVLSAYLCIHLRASLIRARFLLLLLFFTVMGLVAVRAGAGGDVGYAVLALMLSGAWLLSRALPGNGGELAAALLLFQPRALLTLEQGLTVPLVFFCFALALYAVARRAHWVLAGGALALLAASGPYAVLLAIPLALCVPRRRALWALVVGVVAGLSPFAEAFWRGDLQQTDALSFATLAIGRGVPLIPALGLLIGAVVLAVSLRRGAGLPVACAAAAAAWAVALLCSPAAFASGWWLSAGLLAAASASGAEDRVPARPQQPVGIRVDVSQIQAASRAEPHP